MKVVNKEIYHFHKKEIHDVWKAGIELTIDIVMMLIYMVINMNPVSCIKQKRGLYMSKLSYEDKIEIYNKRNK